MMQGAVLLQKGNSTQSSSDNDEKQAGRVNQALSVVADLQVGCDRHVFKHEWGNSK